MRVRHPSSSPNSLPSLSSSASSQSQGESYKDFDSGMDRTSPADSSSSKENNEDAVRAAVHRLHQQIRKGSNAQMSITPSPSAAYINVVRPTAALPARSVARPMASQSVAEPASQNTPRRSTQATAPAVAAVMPAPTPGPSQLQPTPTQRLQSLPSAPPAPSAEPSLYAAVFGPQVASKLHEAIATSTPKTPPQDHINSFAFSTPRRNASSAITPSPSTSRSPYGRNGLTGLGVSARLHAISLLPQLGSPERARRGGPPVGTDPHNSPSRAQLQREELLAHAHPHQSWLLLGRDERSRSPSLDAREGHSGSAKRRRVDEANWSSSAHQQPLTPSRHGVLSNGHPATPLAKDLGLMSGVRSRQPSHSTPHRVRFSSPLQEPATNEETDRVAGVLYAISERNKREKAQSNATLGPAFSPTLTATTPTRKQEGRFADPSSITPRRARMANHGGSAIRRPSTPPNHDEGDDSSANLLLFLAGSPTAPENKRRMLGEDSSSGLTPGHSGGHLGATPSLLSSLDRKRSSASARKALFDDDEDGLARHRRLPAQSAGSPTPDRGARMLQPSPIISSLRDSKVFERGTGRGESRPTSDSPITPPHSNRLKPSQIPLAGDHLESGSSSSQPVETPPYTPFKPSHPNEQLSTVSRSPSPSRLSPSRVQMHTHARLLSGQPLPPPRTPSPAPSESAPRTPHTPNQHAAGGAGSFAYSEFVNVSPSPKPRSRATSERGVFVGRTPKLGSTFGSGSTSAFASNEHEEEMLLTPGPFSAATNSNGNGNGNGSATRRRPSATATGSPSLPITPLRSTGRSGDPKRRRLPSSSSNNALADQVMHSPSSSHRGGGGVGGEQQRIHTRSLVAHEPERGSPNVGLGLDM
ncbi:hypothetical protein BCV69DRAFT_69813 [Microstroma glucosiphilum]|uniref:Uncharacterized protein n=1 Tax=Pseudomicrostroma glucosiphilum TaxID=1684307 RepID=A0A316U1E0_9BASI|nr:hypothetical protein BCV69DRAFT_69813 [Pseudomicrostroma glucosiphilum]PWN18668.1 hypothetical protein BCV69DRAFT_69813 [Pseudomicrostroma glucosiphilum]